MFSQELKEYITHGKEETHIEYKDSMKWSTRIKNKKNRIAILKIGRAMLALANNPNGGVIVIGEKEKNNGEFKPIGVSKVSYDSFKYDDISRYVKSLSSTQIQFKIDRGSMLIDEKDRKFVIIQVAESSEVPVVCIKAERYDETKQFIGDNIALRENAIYIRSKSPIESREISSVEEWKDIINRSMEKSKKELLRRMPCYNYIKDKREKEEIISQKVVESSPEFQKQLKRDEL